MLRRRATDLVLTLMVTMIAVPVGAALTAANTVGPGAGHQLGYDTQPVSGAHVTSIDYTLRSDGVTVDTVTFVAAGDLTRGAPQEHGFVGFTVAGTPGPTLDCGTGTYDGTTATTFVCLVLSLDQPVATIQATDISVRG
ncbi:MAG: hypothetical protein ACLPVY_13895 [Acidimicrobiia bacterium]